MMVVDGTVVNVALPSIKVDLGFSDASLVWIVNAYSVTYAGFRLLTGRLGDLFGHRRLFLRGMALFTLASLVCALSRSQGVLVAARAAQGLCGAAVGAAALSLIINLFTERSERAKAIGVLGFVNSCGGILGLILGGALTDALNWHWIFLINIPIGTVVYALSLVFIPEICHGSVAGRLDVAGAVTVTASSLLMVYAIVDGNRVGWLSAQTIVLFLSASVLLMLFIGIESCTRTPLMPLRILRRANLLICLVANLLLCVSLSAGIFISLYLQGVFGRSPLEVALTFLPSSLTTAVLSLGFSAKLVVRFGIKPTLLAGLLLAAVGLMLLARVPVDGGVLVDVIPGMIVLSAGAGVAANPMLLASMSGVASHETGLISGIVASFSIVGGSLGFAILTSIAAAHTSGLLSSGVPSRSALNGGYHLAFFIGSICAVAAALAGAAIPSQAVDGQVLKRASAED
jgi:EmrB/QacA subfamily drug resistance transporter